MLIQRTPNMNNKPLRSSFTTSPTPARKTPSYLIPTKSSTSKAAQQNVTKPREQIQGDQDSSLPQCSKEASSTHPSVYYQGEPNYHRALNRKKQSTLFELGEESFAIGNNEGEADKNSPSTSPSRSRGVSQSSKHRRIEISELPKRHISGGAGAESTTTFEKQPIAKGAKKTQSNQNRLFSLSESIAIVSPSKSLERHEHESHLHSSSSFLISSSLGKSKIDVKIVIPVPQSLNRTPFTLGDGTTSSEIIVLEIDDVGMTSALAVLLPTNPFPLKLKVNDVILKINGLRPKSLKDAKEKLGRLVQARRTIELDVSREPTKLRGVSPVKSSFSEEFGSDNQVPKVDSSLRSGNRQSSNPMDTSTTDVGMQRRSIDEERALDYGKEENDAPPSFAHLTPDNSASEGRQSNKRPRSNSGVASLLQEAQTPVQDIQTLVGVDELDITSATRPTEAIHPIKLEHIEDSDDIIMPEEAANQSASSNTFADNLNESTKLSIDHQSPSSIRSPVSTSHSATKKETSNTVYSPQEEIDSRSQNISAAQNSTEQHRKYDSQYESPPAIDKKTPKSISKHNTTNQAMSPGTSPLPLGPVHLPLALHVLSSSLPRSLSIGSLLRSGGNKSIKAPSNVDDNCHYEDNSDQPLKNIPLSVVAQDLNERYENPANSDGHYFTPIATKDKRQPNDAPDANNPRGPSNSSEKMNIKSSPKKSLGGNGRAPPDFSVTSSVPILLDPWYQMTLLSAPNFNNTVASSHQSGGGVLGGGPQPSTSVPASPDDSDEDPIQFNKLQPKKNNTQPSKNIKRTYVWSNTQWPFGPKEGCDRKFHTLMGELLLDEMLNGKDLGALDRRGLEVGSEQTCNVTPFLIFSGLVSPSLEDGVQAINNAIDSEQQRRRKEIQDLRDYFVKEVVSKEQNNRKDIITEPSQKPSETSSTASAAPVPRGRLQKEQQLKEQLAKQKQLQLHQQEIDKKVNILVENTLLERKNNRKCSTFELSDEMLSKVLAASKDQKSNSIFSASDFIPETNGKISEDDVDDQNQTTQSETGAAPPNKIGFKRGRYESIYQEALEELRLIKHMDENTTSTRSPAITASHQPKKTPKLKFMGAFKDSQESVQTPDFGARRESVAQLPPPPPQYPPPPTQTNQPTSFGSPSNSFSSYGTVQPPINQASQDFANSQPHTHQQGHFMSHHLPDQYHQASPNGQWDLATQQQYQQQLHFYLAHQQQHQQYSHNYQYAPAQVQSVHGNTKPSSQEHPTVHFQARQLRRLQKQQQQEMLQQLQLSQQQGHPHMRGGF